MKKAPRTLFVSITVLIVALAVMPFTAKAMTPFEYLAKTNAILVDSNGGNAWAGLPIYDDVLCDFGRSRDNCDFQYGGVLAN